ncbi:MULTISPECIES: amidohydrolase [unclassified Arthrobacter]|uniref:amidohydrolase n=1 Tax=unclassified Arthrobacter TaxID=235627 RepID=UPI000701C718|nr:amidohydrolase family protein [Arthrobacter sp. Leaf234]KQO00849.1 amidohydrolase [Arthrobacter sp. Leaf234]
MPTSQRPRPVLYRNGSVYSPADPFATAMLVDGGTVAWVGTEHAATNLEGPDVRTVDLDGALVTPGFVDAHTHTTETGIALGSIDLTACRSLAELLAAVESAAATGATTILGYGWDESSWPERRVPTASELDRAGGGALVYLVRADIHSAVVSGTLAAGLGLAAVDGWDDGFVVRAAHETARRATRRLTVDQRRSYQQAALLHAASRGYVAVTEMAAPHIAPREDLETLLSIDGPGHDLSLPEVIPYWAQLTSSREEVRELMRGFGGRLAGLAGDLNADGSIGSRTAALREPYSDDAGSSGTLYLTEDDAAAHLVATTAEQVQAGFHVIGDAGLDLVLRALERTAQELGVEEVRRARHRLEHVEMADDAAIAALVHYGVAVSGQPVFDALWGVDGGLYEQRLGHRSSSMNRFASLLSAGVLVALGSDSPVTPLDPWASVRACLEHTSAAETISARAAFIAHSRASWRLSGRSPMMGQLAPGTPASFAVWKVDELMVQTPDNRVQSWSTDPRAGTPLLPALDTENAPLCLETVHDGTRLYAVDGFATA